MTGWGVYCISAGRPMNVPQVHKAMRPHPVTWVVPQAQAADYRLTGAEHVLPVPPPADGHSLPVQRNTALDDAFNQGLGCIQTDDDPAKLETLSPNGKAVHATLDHYIETWNRALRDTGACLAGCSPTPNPYFARDRVATGLFIMGQLFAALPSELRFDPQLPVREDYDYTCQHMQQHGAVARADTLLPSYAHWTNRGGCQDYRTPRLDRRVNTTLLERWPRLLKPHPRRPGEILLRGNR
ncbi:hypothetical protein SAMN06265360_10637 [Haloechinothrix alba]|uniref:Uncharacterized protein n=1 Tax=Haloechinothrix alba TaxID=664784 RepID=A0A238WCI1_9PSEU|nr:hypothetical protein [Haloechinothrix alba]SNR44286.1 hypothetical protein SAMN06265360_10637 [Haloechinothrix alba]